MKYERVFAITVLLACIAVSAFAQTRSRNGKIAFTSDRDGNPEIYVINPDGTNEKRLTTNTTIDDYATWSPDGRSIAFLGQKPSGEFAIFIMKANGTRRNEIAQVRLRFPNNTLGWRYWSMSWSPDGRQIVFQDLSSIYIVQADGTGRRFLTTGNQPNWSPDGRKIIFTHQPSFPVWQLHTINPDGTGTEPLPTQQDYWDYAPTWSPDGTRIAFQGWDWANFEDIVIADADGTDRRTFAFGCNVWPTPCGGVNSPDWSPDGQEIVYFLDGYAAQVEPEIYVLKTDGDTPTQITNSFGRNVNPSWQPLPDTAAGDGDAVSVTN